MFTVLHCVLIMILWSLHILTFCLYSVYSDFQSALWSKMLFLRRHVFESTWALWVILIVLRIVPSLAQTERKSILSRGIAFPTQDLEKQGLNKKSLSFYSAFSQRIKGSLVQRNAGSFVQHARIVHLLLFLRCRHAAADHLMGNKKAFEVFGSTAWGTACRVSPALLFKSAPP